MDSAPSHMPENPNLQNTLYGVARLTKYFWSHESSLGGSDDVRLISLYEGTLSQGQFDGFGRLIDHERVEVGWWRREEGTVGILEGQYLLWKQNIAAFD